MEDGMPGSVAEDGRVEENSGTHAKEVHVNVEINGDLIHEEQLEKGLAEADRMAVGGAEGLSPGSVGPAQSVAQMNGDSIRAEELVNSLRESTPAESPPVGMVSDTGASPTPATTTSKGLGLKKWRRIRRDLGKDGGTIADASRILKRGLSITEPPKAKDEGKQKGQYEGESSVASVDSRNMQSPTNSTATVRPFDTELELLGAVGSFSVGIDSETSYDRSSRFSTAASAPKSKHEGLGYGKDKNRVRNPGGRGSGHAVQPRGQRGKGSAVDITKKLREDQLSFEKENSHSSIESDLRSSATVFAQWGGTTGNGRQSEGSLNYDGENRGKAHVSEEIQDGFHTETGGDIEDTSKNETHADILAKDKTEESENYLPDQGVDPFVEPMILLQAAQEALEKEIEKFKEIGVLEPTLSGNSSVQFSYEETEGSSSLPLELKVMKLNQKVEHLENKLREASTTVKAKEVRVIELEEILKGSKLPNSMEDVDAPKQMVKELELELESLFRKKIEAEVECLIMSSASQKKSVTMGDPFSLVEQPECLAEGFEEVKVKLNVAEHKAILLKRKMEELDLSCKELLQTEEILKLQNGVCKFSLFCFFQAMLLFVAFALFLLQLLPPSGDVVPT